MPPTEQTTTARHLFLNTAKQPLFVSSLSNDTQSASEPRFDQSAAATGEFQNGTSDNAAMAAIDEVRDRMALTPMLY